MDMLMCVLMAAVSVGVAAGEGAETDVETIRGRILAPYAPASAERVKGLADAAEKLMGALREDGSWPDIAYDDADRTRWQAQAHVSRLRDMAVAYWVEGSRLHGDAALKAKVSLALDYWLVKDLKNPNWWWNQIGVPQTLGPALLMVRDELTPEQRGKSIEIMKRSTWEKWTGENLVWGTTIQIMRGCAEPSFETLREAYDRFYQEIRIANPGEEGVQVDASFHQHGAQLYSGGYGLGFAVDCAQFMHHARGTAFEAPPEVVDALARYILDGQQWMVRGRTFDYSAVGREIVRPGKSGGSMERAARLMVELPGARHDEFVAFAERMKTPAEHAFSGNRHFWRSDYMAHHRAGYFASVRMASNRTLRSEICNDEGRQSHHLADGVMYLYLSGDEYRDIFPVWDWQRVPGTTCEQMDWPAKGKVGGKGETAFVGGVSDGEYGLAAMDFKRGALTAKKAWFFFDDAIVCLGAGITCASGNPVVTSVNQCLLNGEVVVSGQEAPLASGQHELRGPCRVYHDSVGYVFPQETVVRVANQKQTGKWTDIGTVSRDEVSLDVFSVWLDHGSQAADAAYAYVVYPAAGREDFERRVEAGAFETLSNSPQVQAVRHEAAGITQAAFWQAGALECGEGRFIRVDQACLLVVRVRDGEVGIAAANPLNEPLMVNVETELALEGEGCASLPDGGTRIALTLPEGPMAGSSLVRTFER